MGLLFLIPVFVFVIICILITDGLPIFFLQLRVGRNGKLFRLYKFRSMKNYNSASEGAFDAGDGSRITNIGKIIRKTKLDELPQLINVLKGDMSLVGPRPEVKKWVDEFPERWRYIHTIRPGITDPASVKFRNEEYILQASTNPEKTYRQEILPQKLTLYEDYVNSNSLMGDFKIILATFIAIFK
ncbi:MAG: sugar transferase [Gammaproteobacteria bacterium]|nr:MAG: sugar transferase [Gammaproteobacteria bacterium]